MLRMLAFDFPDSPEAHSVTDQFMLGPSVLVCPILHAAGSDGRSSRVVWLPPAAGWFDFWTGESHGGGTWIDVEVDLDRIPLFIRAGSIVPMASKNGHWTLHLFPGADATITLYDDDGDTYGYERGEYWRRVVSWDDWTSELIIDERTGSYAGGPSRFEVRRVDGQPYALEER
jgi:alpha-D-xyloside xylohydrolase